MPTGTIAKSFNATTSDVVSVVTPDHWHVKIAVEALEAGKHVFCQKPLTLTLEENQLIRNACKKHADRVFLVGTQQRSDSGRFLRAVNMVRKGLLGNIKKVTVGIDGGLDGWAVSQDRAAQTARLGLLARPVAKGRLHRKTLPLRVPMVV